MPECQAKYCTNVRKKGLSTFRIPDPKKNCELCARWLHNLGNAKLDIKTYQFHPQKIVCEKHFEANCFKEDMIAKIMGYKPTRKCLKEDAVPTIFDDRKPVKRRKTSVERHEGKQKDELLSELLLSNDDAAEMTEIASDDDAVSCKKKGHSRTRAKRKSVNKPACPRNAN